MSAYIQEFTSRADVVDRYSAPKDALRGAKVFVAWYGYGDYCGSSFVLFEKDGKLYEVNGSHCSCNGLEGQWDPEETSWAALAHTYRNGTKFYGGYEGQGGAEKRLGRLINRRVPAVAA